MLLAHLSDTHFDGTPEVAERAARVMDYLNGLAQPVDAIIVTGDIADHAEEAEYEEAARILVSERPVYLVPGNHDLRAPYRKVLLGDDSGDASPVNRVAHVGEHAILLVDSTIPHEDPGRIEPETLAWITETLDELRDTPTLLAFHHPPVRHHHPVLDTMLLEDPGPLAEVIAANPQVLAVLTGHTHTAAASEFAGRPLRVAPGVVSTLWLPWEKTDGRTANRNAPPGVAFHMVDDDGGVVTHYRVV